MIVKVKSRPIISESITLKNVCLTTNAGYLDQSILSRLRGIHRLHPCVGCRALFLCRVILIPQLSVEVSPRSDLLAT